MRIGQRLQKVAGAERTLLEIVQDLLLSSPRRLGPVAAAFFFKVIDRVVHRKPGATPTPGGGRPGPARIAASVMLTLVPSGSDAARAAGDPAYGEYLSGTCVTCHGSGGAGNGIPSIDRLSYEYFMAALKEYRDGIRANAAMVSVARGLGDEEIAALAAYYAQND